MYVQVQMNRTEDIMQERFSEWISSLKEEDIPSVDTGRLFLLLEKAFIQGYRASLTPRTQVFISDEEKEALSGWVDLEETR